jgi:cellulose synthase (UDP-forming)
MIENIREWWSDVSGNRQYHRYLEKKDRRRRLTGQLLTFTTIIFGIYYLAWHWFHINRDAGIYAFVFFLAESVGFILFCFFSYNAWFLRYHDPKGVPTEAVFSVDVFIPVAGEPLELVRETLRAALQIDFENKRVYLLDDKGDATYQRLAEETGCGYFARKEHDDAKAGNLNHALALTGGDLILALDADQVPDPQILRVLVGYFKIPKIAFVQSKQDFKVPTGDPFGNRDRIFYNVMQSGKDNDNAAFSCGSGVIYRRKALQEIGGFSTWNLVEDVHTSMLLHQRGWRSIYYNYPLTRGTAPTDIYGVYRQRRQWAADSLRLLFWDSPFHRKGLTFKQKLQYFNLGFVYLVAAFVMPLFFLTPSVSLLSSTFVLTAPVAHYVLHRAPYFIVMSMSYALINYPTAYMKAFQMWTGLFPVFIQAAWIALRSRKQKPGYHVNVKPVGKMKTGNPFLAILPQLGIILLGLFSIVYTFIVGVGDWDFFLLNVLWITWSIWTMSGICQAAIGKHRWPAAEEMDGEQPPSFFSRTKELFATVALAVLVTLFFATEDQVRINNFFDQLRARILQTSVLQETIPKPLKGIPDARTDAPRVAGEVGKTAPTKSEAGDLPTKQWAAQVASVRTYKQARIYKDQLEQAGFTAYITPAVEGKTPWIGVRIGFFNSPEEAQEAVRKIKKTLPGFTGPQWIKIASAFDKERRSGN